MTKGPRWEFGRHLASLVGWRRAADDVREEMRLHVELRARDLEAAGQSPGDARRRAEREVGAETDVLPAVIAYAAAGDRRRSWRQCLDELWHDLRYAARSARRAPGFTVLTVLTMALGLGANAAIFGVVNVAVLTPLPFDPDDTLVRVREYRRAPDGSRVDVDASRRTADAIAVRPDLFSRSVPLSGTGRALARPDGAVRVAATRVGPGFLDVVGIAPVLGRSFSADEERDIASVALISHRLWQTQFGGDPQIVGRSIQLDGRPTTVVGVLQPHFHVPYDTDMWLLSRFAETERSIFILARLAPGVSIDQARVALDVIGKRLNDEYPDQIRGLGVTAVTAREFFVGDDAQTAVALMGAVAVLLLIGCSNVALLMTTRFASRQSEVAVRAALGCSRSRQVRQFVTEGLLLFAAGGAVGLALAAWLKDALVVFLPEPIAAQVGLDGITIDLRVVVFAALLSTLAGIAFGLLAARRTAGADVQAVLKGGGRSVAGSASRGTLGGLVIGEVALALALLTTAGVMVETFRRLAGRDLGFDTTNVTTMRLDFNADRFAEAPVRNATLERVLDRLSALPGVTAAGATTVNPLCCGNWGMRITPEGTPTTSVADTPIIQHFIVTPRYFEVMKQPLVDGRLFTERDRAGTELVVIVDDAAAARFWPGERAIGKRIRRGFSNSTFPWLTVVGVVRNAREEGDYTESWYLPFAQHATGPSADGVHVMLRTSGNDVASAVRAAIRDVDGALPMHGLTSMRALRDENLQQDRLGAVVAASFAAAGLLLAALGLYGVLSFAVNADRREIGVRLALGATRWNVLGLVFGRGLRLTLAGLVIGAGVSWLLVRGLTRVIEHPVIDVRVPVAAASVLLLAALFAMLIPARRALRTDPLRSLRA